MSFPASFGLQLTAVMEALLKAVVAEVTAVVEDRVVELRLELRDRDREIREKQREIEQRDRDILELRAAVEELRAREEAAVSPGEERPEQTESCRQEEDEEEEEEEEVVWLKKEEEDTECLMKWEPTDFLSPPSPLPAPPSSTADNTSTATTSTIPAAGCSRDKSRTDAAQSFDGYSSPETEEFSHLQQADLPFDSPLSIGRGLFHSITQQFSGFRCDQCGKTFTGKKRLITHQSVHTGARPYSCQKCGQRFTRSDSLVRHQKLDSCCK